MRKKASVTHSMYDTPVSHNTDLDDSDSEEMLPMGEFWPILEDEEWTVVKRSHGSLRGANDSVSDRFQNPGKKLDDSGLFCDKLDYINETDNHSNSSEVLPMETAIVSVKPVGCKRPNVNVVIPSKITDRRVNCPVNVVLTPRVRVHESPGIGTQARELFPEGLEVFPEEMAETASTGDLADNQPQNVYELCTKTTVINLTTDYDESKRPAPRRVLVEVTEEASTDDTTIEKCTNDVLDKNETTNRKVSTEMLEIPQQLVTRGFLELAAEARIVRVEKNQSTTYYRCNEADV